MANVTSILGTDLISNSRSTLNTNFDNLNTAKVETSVLTAGYVPKPITASILGSGTASATTFLRGDLSWQTTDNFPSVFINTTFDTAARYTLTQTNTGSVDFDTVGANLNSNSNSNAISKLVMALTNASTFNWDANNCNWTAAVTLKTLGTDIQTYHGLGDISVNAGAINYTNTRHAGFKIVRVSSGTCSLFATQCDGSAETASAALATLVQGDILFLAIRVNASTSVDYFWKKNSGAWSTATNLTTHYPANAGNSIVVHGQSGAAAAVSNITTIASSSFLM